jgi:AP-2 complex subunit alpha
VPPPKASSVTIPARDGSSSLADVQPVQPAQAAAPARRETASDIMSSLAGLDLSAPSAPTVFTAEPTAMLPDVEVPPAIAGPDDLQHNATLGGVNPSLLAPVTVAPNIEKWLERLSYATEGVLYEDKQLQIGINAEYHGSKGRIALFIGNKLTTPFTSVSARIELPNANALEARFHEEIVNNIQPGQQVQEMIHVECKSVFTEQPVLRFTYLAGAFTTLVLRLPIFLNRFIEGVQLDQAAFFERWKIIGGEYCYRQEVGSRLTLLRSAPRVSADLPYQPHSGWRD